MRPQLLKVLKGPGHSFSIRQDLVPHVNNRWHYHKEVELIHFKKGEGTQFIGDNIKRFKAGDVALVGSNLPHYWRFDDAYFEEAIFLICRRMPISKRFWKKQNEACRSQEERGQPWRKF